MVTLGGAKIEGEDLLTLFTCFAVATTRDANNTERLYDTAECKGVAGQLVKRKKPDYLDSTEFKNMKVTDLRFKWRNQVAVDPKVAEMRGSVEDKKDYYLDRASKLLQLYQSKEITDGKKNKRKKIRNEKKMDQAPDDDGFGHFSISGYDHAQTHGDTTSLKSQESDDADPQAPSDDADAVSKAVGDMSLTVTSPPVGPPSATSPPVSPRFQYPYETRGGSGLQDPAQEYAYTDPTTGVKYSLGPGPSYHINRDTAAYSRPPPPQQSPYSQQSPFSQVADLGYKSKVQAGKTAKSKQISSSSSPSGGSDPPLQRRRLEDKEGGGGHKYAETSHEKPKEKHKDASTSEEKEKKDETADRDKAKDKKRPRSEN